MYLITLIDELAVRYEAIAQAGDDPEALRAAYDAFAWQLSDIDERFDALANGLVPDQGRNAVSTLLAEIARRWEDARWDDDRVDLDRLKAFIDTLRFVLTHPALREGGESWTPHS